MTDFHLNLLPITDIISKTLKKGNIGKKNIYILYLYLCLKWTPLFN